MVLVVLACGKWVCRYVCLYVCVWYVRMVCVYVDRWICGYVDRLICGYVSMWVGVCGYVGMWVCGVWYSPGAFSVSQVHLPSYHRLLHSLYHTLK